MKKQLLSLKKLTKSFGIKVIVDNVDLIVCEKERIVIIGENGVGKSTLLKIIHDVEDNDECQLTKDPYIITEYIEQEPHFESGLTVEHYFSSAKQSNAAHKMLESFGYHGKKKDALLLSEVASLSGGTQKIVRIAHAFASKAHVLLIDEPENHLDIVARRTLMEAIDDYWGAIIFVSHDRSLINHCANSIIELKNQKLFREDNVDYDDYMELQERRRNNDENAWKAEKKSIEQLENAVRILAKQAFRGTNTAQYQSRKRELLERKIELGMRPKDSKKAIRMNMGDVTKKSGKLILEAQKADFGYEEGKKLFENVSFDIRFGEKVAIMGRNGVGKSTLLKLLTKQLEPTQGSIKEGNEVKIALFDQSGFSLDAEISAVKNLVAHNPMTDTDARGWLGKMLFNSDTMDIAAKSLSGGQKARLRFAMLLSTKPECIILDEPTNNLDPQSWDVLLKACSNFSGTMILVSHDYAFLEGLSMDYFLVLKNNTLMQSFGELDEVIEQLLA
jgi:ATPase subunit of ABC transporter with duplicated ATPase domains